MFLITTDEVKCYSSINKMISALEGIKCAPVRLFQIQAYTLGWSRCRQFENFHIFSNAYFIGKLNFSEKASEEPIVHNDSIKVEEIPPLTSGTIIYLDKNEILIEPLNVTNVYYSRETVSDMQLLIADVNGFLPSHEGVATLSAVGYFPGNVTLFTEIKKIPFLYRYDLLNNTAYLKQGIEYRAPNDTLMLQRLREITPNHPNQYIGMTAGKDCRFVLGILHAAGIKPTIVHIETNESNIVDQLAVSLDCPIVNVSPKSPGLSHKVYTLATDAQIYMSGSVLGKISPYIKSESIFHTGIFADLILKDTFKTAVKLPGSIRQIYGKCIRMLLSSARSFSDYLQKFNSYEELFKYLETELAYGNLYINFQSKKEWANWFYYLHRGIRWGNAAVMDLSYFTNPVFLLADIKVVTYGISSSRWENYAYERATLLIKQLLPTVTTRYNVEVTLSKNPFMKILQKIEFEYLHRFFVRTKMKKDFVIRSKKEYKPQDFQIIEPKSFRNYYKNNLAQLLKSECSYSLKRAAVTVSYTLNYLEGQDSLIM